MAGRLRAPGRLARRRTGLPDGRRRRCWPTSAAALAQVRRAKSERSLSMRADVALATVARPGGRRWNGSPLAQADLRAAGRIAKLDLTPAAGDLTVTCTF